MKKLRHFLKQYLIFQLAVLILSGIIFPFTPFHALKGYTVVTIYTGVGIAFIGGCIVLGSGYGGIKVDDSYEPNPSLRAEYEEIRYRNNSSHIGMELFFAGIASSLLAYWFQTLISG